MKRTVNLSKRHNSILVSLSQKLDITYTETIQRALEALEEKEVRREKEVKA